MLQKNRLCPPLPAPRPHQAAGRQAGQSVEGTAGRTAAPESGITARSQGSPFLSAEDFDSTGLLAGMDPCESRYWWMPELHGSLGGSRPLGDAPADFVRRVPVQATSRSPSPATAAA